ncbi:M48 family metalloprotease [Paenibacillus motobuensis]|uniref:M56 family metallopeptidase n=1 Tax=Paenibacillus TaxID=44249 RepID=UPI00203C8F18|nr:MULTISPECIES: M56 family metallopeptidase [Paenibacillus]MCM3039465.1 M48 family metalloprotease [Paenibacillus lutimineralis]MCM3646569.1 M48 family metalloprotease [Paenibacillus motobuensis]
MDIAERLFNWFIASTLMASAVAVVVLAVQHLFRRRIHARLRHALWLIVLLRLMLPVLPQSPVSLFNAVPTLTDIKNAVFGISYQLGKPDTISEHSEIENTYQPYYTTNEAEKNTFFQPLMSMKDTEEHAEAGLERESHPAVRVLAIVWLTGAAVLLGYSLTYWLRFLRKQKHLSAVDSPAILKIAEQCRILFSIKRPVRIYADPSAQSPYITGVFRPAVYLPKSLISEAVNEQLLKHVIAHELAHYKRKDTIWNMIGGLVFAVHWMNPFVWFMLRQMKADRELACDACVLEALGEEEAVPYGMTIIGFLRRYANGRSQAHLLYFKGSNGQREMIRRISMIQSFKKGSYKFSMMAVILVLLIGTATLTNANASEAGASAWVHAEDGGNETLFPNEKFRVYDNLEKGAKVAPFTFKVPSLLPEGYGFSDLSIEFNASPSSVNLDYVTTKISKSNGNFSLGIKPGTDLQKQYDQIFKKEQDGTDRTDSGKVIEKESLSLAGIDEGFKITIRMTTWEGQPERYYYLWKDQGISYELSSYGLSSNEMEQIITSMKLPDAKVNKLHVDNDYHGKILNYLYDTEDIRRAQELVGFKAAFPRKLPGDFVASDSYVSRKANFNHVENDEDSMRKLVNVSYSRGDRNQKNKADSGIRDVSFKQMLNGDMYQKMKKNGRVSFSLISGERNNIKLKALTIKGKEVLRTEPYNLDGTPKGPNDLSLVSYFWFDGKVCYQAVFQGQGPEEQKIVQYLMTPDRKNK